MADQTGAQLMREFIPASPFARLLNMSVRALGDGWAELELPFRDDLATMGNTVHGGAIATLADTAAMAAAWSDAPIPERLQGSTVSLSLQYAAAARGVPLVARADVTHRTKRLVFLAITVSALPEGTPVANGVATYTLG